MNVVKSYDLRSGHTRAIVTLFELEQMLIEATAYFSVHSLALIAVSFVKISGECVTL